MDKLCNRCGQTKPIEQFTPDRRKASGYTNPCRDCGRVKATERSKQWRVDNREHYLEQRRQRYAENPTPHLERTQQWREQNREHTRQYARQWNAENIEKKRATSLAWHKNNPLASKANRKRFSTKHAEKIRERVRAWEASHPVQARLNQRMARARSRTRKQGTLVNDLTVAQWLALKEQYGERCAYCGQRCSELQTDHVQPISRGGPNTLSNVVPACERCNKRKNQRTPDEAGMRRRIIISL